MGQSGRNIIASIGSGIGFGLLLILGGLWLKSAIPDSPDAIPAHPPRGGAPAPNVIPPQASIPWHRDVDQPQAVRLAVASRAWVRSSARPVQVDVPLASVPWAQRDARYPIPAEVPLAHLPWTGSATRQGPAR